MLESIAIDGPMRVADGYSQITRGLIKAFTDLGVTVHSNDNWHDGVDLTPEMEAAIGRGFGDCEFGIRLSQPDSFDCCPGRVKVGFSMWEFDAVPRARWRGRPSELREVQPWGEGMNEADICFVPCEHSRRLWLDAGCTKPVHVVPLGYDPRIYSPITRYSEDWMPENMVFIITGTLSSRKNPVMLMEAFAETFKPEDKARLIVKTCANLPLGEHEHPSIRVISETWPAEQIAKLYEGADVFVCPTEGEGFGLNFMEAMATGLPVIAPWWSGTADYLDESNSWRVETEHATVSSDFCLDRNTGEYQQFGFERPMKKSLKEQLWHCYTHPSEVREKARAAQETAMSYTWLEIAVRIIEILEASR